MDIKRISVVGAGLMGKGIAHNFAAFGYKVDLFGRRDEVKNELIKYFDREVEKERVTPEQRTFILNNISVFNINLEAQQLACSDLIIETVTEDMGVKKEIFSVIGRYAGSHAILASNTSSYTITSLAEFTSYPENFLGMHFFSPVSLMKLVEIIKGEKTSAEIIQRIFNLLEGIDKLPIKVTDSPGFALNRVLVPFINEAVNLYYERVVESVEDIDDIFVNGMNLRVGPLKLADLVGIDVVYAGMSNLYKELKDAKYQPCPLIKQMVDEGRIGKKVGKGFYK